MANEAWWPGSFTKNFGWGRDSSVGLAQLYENIRVGFDGEVKDVRRSDYRRRVGGRYGPDFIPLNFFLFNARTDGEDYILVDELVFQALTAEHSAAFDKLALFAFLMSFVGTWRGARSFQRRPALWATRYIEERVAGEWAWNVQSVNADDIERFVGGDSRYRGETARKLSTNLNYLFLLGRLGEFSEQKVERWWVDALFLAIDRLVADRGLDGVETTEGQFASLLNRSDFMGVSGKRSVDKDLAVPHLLRLYAACGGRQRFFDDSVRERTLLTLPEVNWILANDTRPQGAIHPTNVNILKAIPRACAMLAKYAGFEVLDADELENLDTAEFVRRRTREALARLRDKNIVPVMTEEELMRLTRGN